MRGFTKREKEQAQKEANEAIARLKKSQAKYISRPIDKKKLEKTSGSISEKTKRGKRWLGMDKGVSGPVITYRIKDLNNKEKI